MFAVRQYQLATSVPIGGHVRDHCHPQLSLCILQTRRDWTSFCVAGWSSETQYQVGVDHECITLLGTFL